MIRLWLRPTAVALVVLLAAGCAAYNTEKKMNRYEYTTSQYEKAIRWGSYEVADTYRKPPATEESRPDFERLKQFSVTSYKIVNEAVSEERDAAQLTVEIRYYDSSTMTERAITDKQHWTWDNDAEVWVMEGSLPAFK